MGNEHVLVDSNVLLDIVAEDPVWADRSAAALAAVLDGPGAVINPLIFAEVSVRFETVEALDAALPPDLRRHQLPYAAAFLAGKCFRAYRRAGGTRTSSLPDFYIGAHAAVAGYRLLTRDARRYRTYFPRLDILTP